MLHAGCPVVLGTKWGTSDTLLMPNWFLVNLISLLQLPIRCKMRRSRILDTIQCKPQTRNADTNAMIALWHYHDYRFVWFCLAFILTFVNTTATSHITAISNYKPRVCFGVSLWRFAYLGYNNDNVLLSRKPALNTLHIFPSSYMCFCHYSDEQMDSRSWTDMPKELHIR